MTASFANAEDIRIRVAIVDSGILPGHSEWYCKDAPPKDFTGMGIYDVSGHGTNVAGIIAKPLSPKTHCFIIVKWYHDKNALVAPAAAISYAVQHRAQYLNLSFYGAYPDPEERLALEYALEQGVTVVVSSGNDKHDLTMQCDAYPACYNFVRFDRFYVIANCDQPSNYGGPVTKCENGTHVEGWNNTNFSGSSQAAAIFTGEAARVKVPTRHY